MHDKNGDGVLSGAEVRDDPNQVIVRSAERWTSTGVYLREGDVVRIEETRPLSKQKRWTLVEKLPAHR